MGLNTGAGQGVWWEGGLGEDETGRAEGGGCRTGQLAGHSGGRNSTEQVGELGFGTGAGQGGWWGGG